MFQSMLSCHLNWHSAIFHIEKGDYKAALDIFDEQVSSSSCDIFDEQVSLCSYD